MAPLPARQNAKDNLKRKPDDGSSFFASQNTVNNGVAPTQVNDNNKNKVRPSDEVLAQQGTRREEERVPTTQRGGAPVVANPTAVSPETETTLSPSIAKLLNTQGQRQLPKPANDNLLARPTDFNQENFPEQNYANDDFNQEQIINQNIDDEEEEVEEPKRINTVDFPFILFTFCIVEWIFVLVLSLVGTVLGIILLPVGLAIETALEAWKVGFGVYLFIWMTAYEKKYLNSFRSVYKNSKRLSELKKPKILGRRMFVGITIIPIVGDILPLNVIAVYKTYSGVKKELDKLNG